MKMEKAVVGGFGLWFAFCAVMGVATTVGVFYLIYLAIQVANQYLNG